MYPPSSEEYDALDKGYNQLMAVFQQKANEQQSAMASPTIAITQISGLDLRDLLV